MDVVTLIVNRQRYICIRQLRLRPLSLLKRKKENELTDNDLLIFNDIMVESGGNRTTFALLLKKAGEKVDNPVFGALLDNYSPGLEIEIKKIETKIVNDAMRLMVLNLLEDIDEDDYVDQMELLKENLKIVRKLERWLNLNKGTGQTKLDLLAVITDNDRKLSKNK